jgi:glycosidase
MRMKHHWVLVIIIMVVLSSCKEQKNELATPSLIQAMTTPIYASNGQTDVIIDDYLPFAVNIDSIVGGAGIMPVSTSIDSIYSFELQDSPAVNTLTIWVDGVRNDIPVFKSLESVETIKYDSESLNNKIQIKGEFTNWQTVDLQTMGKDLYYEASVPYGKFQYLFVIDGEEEKLTGNEPDAVSNGMGGFNRQIVNERTATPATLNYGEILDNGFTFTSSSTLDNIVVLYENQMIPAQQDGNSYTVQLPEIDFTDRLNKTQLVRVYASDSNGRTNDLLVPVQNNQVVTDASNLDRSDFHAQLLYFMMIDRFLDADSTNTQPVNDPAILPKANYMGGDLAGVLEKIEDGYFTDMGINTIWLSPVTQNPDGAYGLWPEPETKFSGYHGYWPISNTKVDYRFGDQQLMNQVIDAAHKNDVNVILDYVANHVHEEHPLYRENPDWVTNLYLPDSTLNTERWDDHRLTTWFDTFMPTLDFSQPEVVEKMTDSALYWMTEYDLDGFRHDATKHVPEAYWRTLTEKIRKNTNRPIYQIGETYGSYDLIRSYVSTGMLDAQFDFNMYDAAVAAFVKADKDYANLAATLNKGLEYYGHHHLMGNISGNQDRARFISYASGDVQFDEDAKLAGWTRETQMSDSTAYDRLGMLQAYNMTIPGVPVIYYGDEYGSIGAGDPDNRRMMRFNNLTQREQNLRDLVQQLTQLRRNSMSLLYGTTQVVADRDGVLELRRSYFNEQTSVFFNENPISLNVVDKNARFRESETTLINTLENDKQIQVKARNFAIVKARRNEKQNK